MKTYVYISVVIIVVILLFKIYIIIYKRNIQLFVVSLSLSVFIDILQRRSFKNNLFNLSLATIYRLL